MPLLSGGSHEMRADVGVMLLKVISLGELGAEGLRVTKLLTPVPSAEAPSTLTALTTRV